MAIARFATVICIRLSAYRVISRARAHWQEVCTGYGLDSEKLTTKLMAQRNHARRLTSHRHADTGVAVKRRPVDGARPRCGWVRMVGGQTRDGSDIQFDPRAKRQAGDFR